MEPAVTSLLDRIRALEAELEAELARQRAGLQYRFEQGRVAFETAILQRHRELKTRLHRYILGAGWLSILTAPAIYAMIVPIALLDFGLTLYQWLCFPAYGIAQVRRRDYLIFDRRHLAYLNLIEKINCAYCSYANGVIAYGREIAGRTEKYWCPIKHARRAIGTHAYYAGFAEFGDAGGFRALVDPAKQGPTPPVQVHLPP